MIGKTVSHYRIMEQIGTGGMGVVYRAEDTRLQRTVALKFLPADLTRDPDARSRFQVEARAASALDHQNICTIYDVGETDEGRMYISMAYCEGETLKAKIARGPLPVDEVRNIARQLAEGLKKAHAAGVVHRDVKPANIIINKAGEVKIVDFGLAKLLNRSEVTRSGYTVGTPAYMSPEQARGEPVDYRTDIWSFGVVLYEMITGRLPFRGGVDPAIIYEIVNEDPVGMDDTLELPPNPLVSLCMKCLDKDKTSRPDLTSGVLETLLSDPTVQRAVTPGRRRRIRPVYLGVAAAVVIVILSALSIILFVKTEEVLTPRTDRWRVGILYFESINNRPELEDWPGMIQMLLARELTGVSNIGVVDPVSLNGFIQNSFGGLDILRGQALYDNLDSLRMDQVIDGAIIPAEKGVMIQVKVINPADAEIGFSHEATIGSEGELPGAVRDMAHEIVSYFQVKTLSAGFEKDLEPWVSSGTEDMGALRAFIMACQYIYAGNPQSEKYLRRAIELDPMFISPRIWLISNLAFSGRMEEAMEHYRFLKSQETALSPVEQVMMNWADACVRNDIGQQIHYLVTALEYSPGNNILLYSLARLRYLTKDYQSAVDLMEQSKRMKWWFSPAYYTLGASYFQLDNMEEAERNFQEALSFTPILPDTYFMLGQIFETKKDPDQAKNYYSKYLELRPEGGLSASAKERLAVLEK